MEASSSPLAVSDASLPNQTLWFGKAELYETHIRIAGWNWSGRYEQRIDLEDVESAQTWSHSEGANLILQMKDSSQPLRLEKGVMLWHWKLKELNVKVDGRG
jgi:hypothetical protein